MVTRRAEGAEGDDEMDRKGHSARRARAA